MLKNGDKVLVRIMECTNKKLDQWDIVYKTAVIVQENILDVSSKKLFTIKFSNGESDYAWSNHILAYPKEWVDSRSDLC